ncbi:sedoheptulose 7-phosphate cyclase [Streptomyces sp. XH2]|uniref:sedoheptulose 7-phosphate cyclase n=1 Tax=Streptomyces sp. XH2 TaxID=3412483 RepID=UPI003C7C923B
MSSEAAATAAIPSAPFDMPRPPGLSWYVQAHHHVGYEVNITRNLLSPSNPTLARACGGDGRPGTRCLVVVDSTVDGLYGARLRDYFAAKGIEPHWLTVPGDEDSKDLDHVVRVTEAMTDMGILRRTEKVVAVGGGVLLDVVGMAASLYRRGVPYIRVPTTLLGQVDAGVGVKTGVNQDRHKNRLGTYFAPQTALIDTAFLRTIDPRHVANGLAEIIKMALVKDAVLFGLLERTAAGLTPDVLADCAPAVGEMISRAIAGMLDELEPNLWESVLERSVDYGHTFSPSLELRADPPLLHGEAVAVDMAVCLALAHNRGLLTRADADRGLALLRATGLPVTDPVFTADLLESALRDAVKHRDGLQRVPLTDAIGSVVFVNDITRDELGRALSYVHSYAERAAAPGAAALSTLSGAP